MRDVATGMFRILRRVDDVAKRFTRRCDALHGRPHLLAHRGNAGIDEQDPLFAGLHRDIAASSDDHGDVAAHGKDLNFARCGLDQLAVATLDDERPA